MPPVRVASHFICFYLLFQVFDFLWLSLVKSRRKVTKRYAKWSKTANFVAHKTSIPTPSNTSTNMKTYTDRHPAISSVLGVVLWFLTILVLSCLTSCKSTKPVSEVIVTHDTLYVYHNDTVHTSHTDTIRQFVTKVVHDSIIKEIKVTKIIDQDGNVIHSEKETNNETWHNAVEQSQHIQHTVDSILHAKMDSIYQAGHSDHETVVEKQPQWYDKVWQWIKDRFASLGVLFLLIILAILLRDKLKKNLFP